MKWYLLILLWLSGCGGKASAPENSYLKAINDTGVKICVGSEDQYVDCSGVTELLQDGHVGRDANSPVKLGQGDAGFDFSVLRQENGDSCILDNVTGLVWERKSSDPLSDRYGGHTYTWYSQDSSINGGEPGIENGGKCLIESCDTSSYIAYLNRIEYCGLDTWRMPTAEELSGIAHYGKVNFAIDENIFPNTFGLRYWSANVYAEIPILSWYVYFSDASVSVTHKNNLSFVRAVAGR